MTAPKPLAPRVIIAVGPRIPAPPPRLDLFGGEWPTDEPINAARADIGFAGMVPIHYLRIQDSSEPTLAIAAIGTRAVNVTMPQALDEAEQWLIQSRARELLHHETKRQCRRVRFAGDPALVGVEWTLLYKTPKQQGEHWIVPQSALAEYYAPLQFQRHEYPIVDPASLYAWVTPAKHDDAVLDAEKELFSRFPSVLNHLFPTAELTGWSQATRTSSAPRIGTGVLKFADVKTGSILVTVWCQGRCLIQLADDAARGGAI